MIWLIIAALIAAAYTGIISAGTAGIGILIAIGIVGAVILAMIICLVLLAVVVKKEKDNGSS